MPRKRHSPEQILRKLREVEVSLAKGETVARAIRQIAVTEQTYRVVHYINQFFGGIGAEEHANIPTEVRLRPMGI